MDNKKENKELLDKKELSDNELLELVGGAKETGFGRLILAYGIRIPMWWEWL